MADPKKNPLIGSFRDPAPEEKAPPGKAGEKKPSEPPRADPKAVAPATTGKAEEKKPPELPMTDPKTTAPVTTGKAGEKKPPEPSKADPKAAAPATTGKAEEKKPPEPSKADSKAVAPSTTEKAEEKKPPELSKITPKAAGAILLEAGEGKAPAMPQEDKLTAGQRAAITRTQNQQKRIQSLSEEAKGPIRFVKLSEIQPLPGTYVKDTPRSDYSDMIASIKKSGLERPVILRQGEKGGYQLVDGFHRCEAVKQAGMLEIRADVYDMTVFEATRYRKKHRENPDLSIPGKLVPFQTKEMDLVPKGEEIPDEPETELSANLKIPLTPTGQSETVTSLKIADIRPFEGHPFNVKDDEDMKNLVDSVRQFGVLEPAMVIPHKDGGYEMVSGHRRMRACELAGVESMPVIIRDLDRDEAIISMVDSNLKREKISPMEKARAYQMKTDAMRRKVGRRSKTEILNGEKPKNADQELAEQVGESVATVQRFKTLNKLTPELQKMVDQGKIPVNTGADIAQMKPSEQNVLADAIKREDKVPTGAKAKELKEASKAGTLTVEKINETVAPTKREMEPELKVTFTNEELRSYFPDKSTTVGEVKRVVFESLTMRQKALERRAREAAEKGKPSTPIKSAKAPSAPSR